jgi:hypothetical protein
MMGLVLQDVAQRVRVEKQERQVLYAWTAMNGFSRSVGELGGIGLCWMGR